MGGRIAIIGTGAVGGYVGAHMAQAGEDVTLVDFWPENVETIRTTGLHISHAGKVPEFTTPARALHVTELQRFSKELPIDIAFVCTKSYDTAWATTMVRQYLAPGGFVVSLQNCINEETIAGIVGWGKTLARSRAPSPSSFASRATSDAPLASAVPATPSSASARCTALSPTVPGRSAACSRLRTPPR